MIALKYSDLIIFVFLTFDFKNTNDIGNRDIVDYGMDVRDFPYPAKYIFIVKISS